jgi:molybdate transport system substrate-binding protein
VTRPPTGRPTRRPTRRTSGPGRPLRDRPTRSIPPVAAVALAAAVALSGCGGGAPDGRLTIFAASSLRDVVAALADEYETGHPGVTVVVASDASSTLRVQIEQGAPADVFAPASPAEIEPLAAAGLTSGAARSFATARVVLAVPSRGSSVTDPWDLADDDVRIVSAAPPVPIARYGSEVLGRLAALPGAPADFAARVAANVVSEEANVRAVVAKLELGEGDAGFAYAPDLRGRPAVREVQLPVGATIFATYAAVGLVRAADPGRAADFVDWLAGDDAQAIIAGFGFGGAG